MASKPYGQVISARIPAAKAKLLARMAKRKSTDARTYRPSDLLRVALDEYIERSAQKEAA